MGKGNNGICSDYYEPYLFVHDKNTPKGTTCENNKCVGGNLATAEYVNYVTTEAQMKEALNYGPVSGAIDASCPMFQNYKSGIMDNLQECNQNLDHAIIFIGYGSDNGVDYWLVRNSWNT